MGNQNSGKRPNDSFFITVGVRHKGICQPENKLKYESRTDAELALKECQEQREFELRANGFSNRNEASVYDCIFCKHWHLTSLQTRHRL